MLTEMNLVSNPNNLLYIKADVNVCSLLGLEPVFTRRGVVAVRSLKSGYGEFLQDAPLTDVQISQLEVCVSC